MNTLDAFYPIADSAAMVSTLVQAGAHLVQLRIKGEQSPYVRAQTEQAALICRHRNVQLVVNDHWQIAIDSGIDFVHLGQGDLQGADLPALRRHGVRLGISTHDREELDRALSIQPTYVALGPIWPTSLKVMPWAPQGIHRLTEWKRLIGSLPLVAIGGITVDRARSCLGAGADSVAVVSDVVRHPDPAARVKLWQEALQQELA